MKNAPRGVFLCPCKKEVYTKERFFDIIKAGQPLTLKFCAGILDMKMDKKMEFSLRPWRESDIPSVYLYANNPKIANNLRDVFPYPYERKDAEEYILGCIQNEGKGQLCRAICLQDCAIGSIGVFLGTDVYRKSAEVGYWLAEPYWGKGIMSGAISKICQEAFEVFDIVRIHAEPFAYNMGSRRALEKAGFSLEAVLKKSVVKNGVIYDSGIYALVK